MGTPWGLLQDHFPEENAYIRVKDLEEDEDDMVYKGKRTGRIVRFAGEPGNRDVEVLDDGDPDKLNAWEREAVENGDLEAEWVRGRAPVAKNPPLIEFIKWAGVNYGDELPVRLKTAGVTVVNEKGDL